MQNKLVKVQQMSDEQLIERLSNSLGRVAIAVVDAAACVGELDNRGFDFNGKIAPGTLRFLRLIADGKLLGCVMEKQNIALNVQKTDDAN